MRKLAIVVVSVALAFATGCATKAYVKSQVDPLSERIGRIEARLDAIDAKLVQLSKDAEMAKADHAAIEDVITSYSIHYTKLYEFHRQDRGRAGSPSIW